MNELSQTNNEASFSDVLKSVSGTTAASPTGETTTNPNDAVAQFMEGSNDVTHDPFQQQQQQHQQEQQLQQQPAGMNVAEVLSAELAVTVIDGIAARGLPAIGSMIGVSITRQEAKATAEEKRQLIPATDAMLKALNIRITNPFEAFAFSVVLIYGQKLVGAGIETLLTESENPDNESDLNKVAQITAKKKRKPGAGRPKKVV